MEVKNIIKKLKSLPSNTEFRCKVNSGKQASNVMFRILEHYNLQPTVTERKLGRFLKSVSTKEYPQMYAYYDATTGWLAFSNCRVHDIKNYQSTYREPKPKQVLNSLDECNMNDVILRQQISSRGGGIEISLSSFGYEGEKMTAYQNYLGGGLLGSIGNDCTIKDWQTDEKLTEIAQNLAKYMHSLTNPDDEWEGMDFETRQSMPKSAY